MPENICQCLLPRFAFASFSVYVFSLCFSTVFPLWCNVLGLHFRLDSISRFSTFFHSDKELVDAQEGSFMLYTGQLLDFC